VQDLKYGAKQPAIIYTTLIRTHAYDEKRHYSYITSYTSAASAAEVKLFTRMRIYLRLVYGFPCRVRRVVIQTKSAIISQSVVNYLLLRDQGVIHPLPGYLLRRYACVVWFVRIV